MYSFENAQIYSSIELEISDSVEVFNKLLNNLNESITNIKLKHKAEVEEDEKFNDGAEHSILQLEDLVIDELEKQQYYAYCLTLHSSFEGKLKRICNKIEMKLDSKIKLADLNGGNDLKKFFNYLDKVFEMDMAKIQPYYDTISKHKIVRNKITHNNGIITIVEKSEITKLNLKHIEIDMIEEKDMFQIKLNNEYILVLNENISSFYKELIPEIDERYKTLKLN